MFSQKDYPNPNPAMWISEAEEIGARACEISSL